MFPAGPLTELNETLLALSHAPTPPSYFAIDWDEPSPDPHRAMMIWHAVLLSVAFFGALPIGNCKRYPCLRLSVHGPPSLGPGKRYCTPRYRDVPL